MAYRVENNLSVELGANVNDSATTLTLASGNGAELPSVGSGQLLQLTAESGEGDVETFEVTAISGDTLTVTRGAGGTTAAAWTSGQSLEVRVTKDVLNAAAVGTSPFVWTLQINQLNTVGVVSVNNAAWASVTGLFFGKTGGGRPNAYAGNLGSYLDLIGVNSVIGLFLAGGGDNGCILQVLFTSDTNGGAALAVGTNTIIDSRGAPIVGALYELIIIS